MSARFRKSGKVPWRIIEGEAILVSTRSQQVLYLNESATEVWKVLDEDKSLEEIVDHLCACFEIARDQAEQDVLACIGELRDLGAVEDVVG